jgi:hypothetical protein
VGEIASILRKYQENVRSKKNHNQNCPILCSDFGPSNWNGRRSVIYEQVLI